MSTKLKKYLHFLSIMVAAIALWALYVPSKKETSLPIYKRFNIAKVGEALEIKFEITEESIYQFGLSFFVDQRDSINDTEKLYPQLEQLEHSAFGKESPFLVEIELYNIKDSSTPILKEKENHLKTNSHNTERRNMKILDFKAKKGIYIVKIKNLKSIDLFNNRKIKFYISKAHHGN